jgi:hypothetical protein
MKGILRLLIKMLLIIIKIGNNILINTHSKLTDLRTTKLSLRSNLINMISN